MSRLATSLGRRDEAPNQELAMEIATSADEGAVRELVDNLSSRDKSIQSDCIKVLYEIGARAPTLIAAYHEEFGRLLGSNNNRLVWGGMTALDSIATLNPKGVQSLLPEIMTAAESGSVIARDHAVGILVKLIMLKEYTRTCFPLLLGQLKKCPNNQLPMYAEMSLPVVTGSNRKGLATAIRTRLRTLEKESQRRRVEKLLSSLE